MIETAYNDWYGWTWIKIGLSGIVWIFNYCLLTGDIQL